MRSHDLPGLLDDVEVWQPLDEKLAWQPKSDLGNAERLIARFGENLLYVDSNGWHAWDKRRWNLVSGEPDARRYSHKTALAIRNEVRALEAQLARKLAERGQPGLPLDDIPSRIDQLGLTDDVVKEHRKPVASLARWCVDSGNSGRSRAMLDQAGPYLLVQPDAMNPNPYLFNVANCTLDLDAKPPEAPDPDKPYDIVQSRPHARDDLISQISEVPYDPEAEAPVWRKFVADVLQDPEVRAFVQRWFGYCLTGMTSEQAFLVMYGEGANGKSTLLEALRPVFGDFGVTVDMNSFLHNGRQRGSDASPDFARLPHRRFATAAEINTGDWLSEKTVKSITGGEAMTARQLHKPFFEFYPVIKLILSCNQKPVIRAQDKGTWRRVLLLPFTRSFDKSEIDKHLVEKLRREEPGILNWCLAAIASGGRRGCRCRTRCWRPRRAIAPTQTPWASS